MKPKHKRYRRLTNRSKGATLRTMIFSRNVAVYDGQSKWIVIVAERPNSDLEGVATFRQYGVSSRSEGKKLARDLLSQYDNEGYGYYTTGLLGGQLDFIRVIKRNSPTGRFYATRSRRV